MNFELENKQEREFYAKKFSKIKLLTKKIRNSLITGNYLCISDLNLDEIIDYKGSDFFVYISIFQEFKQQIRFGSKRKTLTEALNRIIDTLRNHKRFAEFDISDPKKTRILIEYITDRKEVNLSTIHAHGAFDESRFEPGITGIEINYNNSWYNWLPTDAIVLNKMDLMQILGGLYNKISPKEKKLKNGEKYKKLTEIQKIKTYLTKSKAFVTFENEIIPLYRGNVLYEKFDFNLIKKISLKSNDWLVANMLENGQFRYYYNLTSDNYIDHEHPTRREPNLYYNDLRHAGGAITLLWAYKIKKDKRYIKAVKKAIDWSISMTKFHKDDKGREAAYVFANEKAKLGGVGIPLIMLMKYRITTKDKTYDKYIEAYAKHLISRITPEGEFLGYYIHPSLNDGKPLLTMSDADRKRTFSFYYPGEALLGLALVANKYNKNEELKKEIIEKCKIAMDWIILKRPKIYPEMFTALPSDSWLMQAIEEWANCKGFMSEEYLKFVINDATTMMEKMYTKDDSPYIDFEGGMYYDYGDHYYPDGARCEGLIAAYYLAKKMKMNNIAKKLLDSAKLAAKCQYQLWVNKYNNYGHLNPKRTCYSIKFKATRQWIRVDSIQHVSCFFTRLYLAKRNLFSFK